MVYGCVCLLRRDECCCLVCPRHAASANVKLGIGTLDLQQHVALCMGMLDKGPVHIKQSDPPERPDSDPQSRRHQESLPIFANLSISLTCRSRDGQAFQNIADGT